MKKKILAVVLTLAMVVSFMPTMAFATGDADGTGDTSPAQTSPPTLKDGVWQNVTPDNIQDLLDGKYGIIDNTTIELSAGEYEKLELGRATKYEGSHTDYYIGGISDANKKTYAEFTNIKSKPEWSGSAYYVRNMSNVTFKAADGATVNIAGLEATAGHVYADEKNNICVYDYVLEKEYTNGSAYYKALNLESITFDGINFTASVNIASSQTETEIDEVTFRNCNFNIGNTNAGYYALRYYNEGNTGKIKNLVVYKCTFNTCYQGIYTQNIKGITVTNSVFNTTGHNAIAIQESSSNPFDHGNVTITENYFANIGDRIIRLGDVGSDTQFTINGNTATNSGDNDDEVIKAESLADNVTYDISGNDWGNGTIVCNDELNDPAYKVNGVEYKTLASAIEAAEAGSTITLMKNATENNTLSINKKITLDLSGNILTTKKQTAVSDEGILTIKDSANGGQINLECNGGGIMLNEGKLILESGTLYQASGENVFLMGSSEFEMNGGSLLADNGACIDAAYCTTNNEAKVNITGGKVATKATNTCAIYVAGRAILGGENTGKASLTISGGEFSSEGDVVILVDGKNSSLTVTGGTFKGAIKKNAGTITIKGGLFTTKPDATYCAEGMAVVASGNSKYPFTVTQNKAAVKTADTAATKVEAKNAKIAVTKEDGKSATEEETKAAKTAVTNAATAVAATTSEGLEVAAVTEAQKTVTEKTVSDAKETLKKALNVNDESAIDDSTTVNIFVQPYLDITIADAKVTTTTTGGAGSGSDETVTATVRELTLDIVPMVKTIATTASSASDIVTAEDINQEDRKTQNAVEIGEAKETTVTTPVTITIPLPSGFVSDTNNIYIKHTKTSGASYVYTATVKSDNDASPTYSATFTNPNGFSTFVVTAENPAVAEVNGIGYETLQAAVNAVEEGGTITVLKDVTGQTATVGKTISFNVALAGGVTTFDTNAIKAGSHTTKTVSGTSAPYTYNFVYTRPSSGGGGGGGSTVEATTYDISVPSGIAHGSVSLSKNSAAENDKVTLTVKPDKGYTLEVLKATDDNGKEVELTAVELGKEYTFVMPASKVSFEVSFMDDNSILNYFVDVNAADYFYDAVLWAAEKEITTGMDDSHFAPNGNCTRAQIVTFLWRAAGSPEVTTDEAFSDVASDSYYAKAVAWAVANGITTGTEADKFSPDDTCTRAQSVTFLARALKGTAEASAEFNDVASDSYYASAVAWAKANGITMGVTESTFGPDNDCTRAQIVTFLYRGYANK